VADERAVEIGAEKFDHGFKISRVILSEAQSKNPSLFPRRARRRNA
jgi:hypothetical protein